MKNKRYPQAIEHLPKSFQILILTFVKRLDTGKNCLVAIVGGTGCQPKGNNVLMANGEWKDIKDIKIGDKILSPQKDGSNIISKVTDTTNWICEDTYDITKKNGTNKKLYSCSDNHIIPVHRNYTERRTKNGKRYIKKSWWDFTTYQANKFSQMSSKQKSHQNIGFSSFLIDKYDGRTNCEIEPYTLGAMLGDGMFRNKLDKKKKRFMRALNITSLNKEIINEISKHYEIINFVNKKGTSAKSYSFSLKGKLSKQMVKCGLEGKDSGTKFIPKEALVSDAEYRKKLLAGLIDTDGHYKNGGYEFTQKSKQLVENIRDLVYSLGGRCSEIKKVKKGIKGINFMGTYYYISFYIGNLKLPLQLKRKERDIPTIYLDSNRVAIDSIKTNKKEMVYGFTIDSPSQWYVTNNWMVTHNSGKSFASTCILYWTYIYMNGKEPTVEYMREHWFFAAKDFLEKMNDPNLKKREGNLWDEMGTSASHKTHQSLQNRAISWLVQTFRNLEQLVIFTVPTLAFVDKSVRNLLHYQLETRKILISNKVCIIKPLEIQYNIRMDKTYYHNLLKPSNDGSGFMDEIDVVGIPLPPKEIVEAYEEDSWKFKAELNKRIQGMLEKVNEKEKFNSLVGEEAVIAGLNGEQKKVWNLLMSGITEPRKIIEDFGITQSSYYYAMKSFRLKGLDVDKYLKNKNSEKPILKIFKNDPSDKLTCKIPTKPLLNNKKISCSQDNSMHSQCT